MKHGTATPTPAYGAQRIEQRRLHKLETPVDLTLLEIDTIEAVASHEVIYQLAAILPVHEAGTPGRRPHYPPWVHVLHKALAGVLGSHSKAARAMAHPVYWRSIRHHAATHSAPRPPRRPPQRWHHNYAQRLLDDHTNELLNAFRPLARRLATELGCLAHTAPVSHTNPARGQYVVGDGTVVAAPVRKATADRWAEQGGRHVHAGIEVQNGDNDSEFRWGTKFVLIGTRPNNIRNNRMVLDVDAVPSGKGYGGEARVAIDMIDRVVADPDVRCDGVCYDGAFRGIHIDHAMKHGLTVLSPIHDGTRKPAALAPLDCPCGEVHELWTEDGRICERQILDTGEKHLQACPVGKIFSRRNADGSHRWYIEFATPSCGTVHRQRIDTTDDDRKRGYNRAEHLRQHIKTDDGDSVYDRCYGWREDSESLNNTLDRTLYGGRMIAYTAVRQLAVMLGFALGRNAIAAYLHRRRHPDERAA
ncbi:MULTISPECIES: hypothetical protein [Mycobacterium]|uniref:hypothetical protein n=1 Tax=Mycobacterium TaxID=1763 RepID=UPI0002B615D3|nr:MULTISPECIES: hypothetical protein [Mycobacterium]AFV14791.1 hypothetical protein OEM_p100110 [Mycobacterium intracellulare subsp. yongonense 05-1390]BDE17355.1 hypothetical protein MKCMC460_62150 [Mycobacterium sp. 20KCMC460]GLC22513.1 hypothetical protein SRL2020472_50840 [Mycobacterium kiyosense]GLC98714.1 hypothetical protein Mkiyose1088_05810 [Mycobacterium kiyosense]GLD08659.1 hypothetical protein Mkiyose1383_49850 [Mycobacterium kiyosense]